MNIRCPNCGAENSLDSLIADSDAAELLLLVLELDKEIGKAAIRYLGLFRPAKSKLGWGRVATLLKELLPDMQRGVISRNGSEYPAPPAAWVYGFQTALAARDEGRLKLPLKSHGWLYEVIAAWQPAAAVGKPANTGGQMAASGKPSQTLTAAAQLEGLKR